MSLNVRSNRFIYLYWWNGLYFTFFFTELLKWILFQFFFSRFAVYFWNEFYFIFFSCFDVCFWNGSHFKFSRFANQSVARMFTQTACLLPVTCTTFPVLYFSSCVPRKLFSFLTLPSTVILPKKVLYVWHSD